MDAAQSANVTDLPGVRGRKDSDGQEQVIDTTPLKKKVKELGELRTKLDLARQALNDAIKAVAKKSGLGASAVRKLVNARGEKFEDEKRKVDQAALVFEEVGNE